jgi:hypothetical protein
MTLMTIPQHASFDSSVLAAAAYDGEQSMLQLDFRSGALYRYFDVDCCIWEALFAAASKGTFFHQAIRDHFRFVRLR